MTARLLSCLALLVAGCGGGGSGLYTEKPDLTPARDLSVAPDLAQPPDLAVPPDLAMPLQDLRQPPVGDAAGVVCGNMTCGKGLKCCVEVQGMGAMAKCLAGCPDGNFPVACDGPEDCGGNPCCVDVKGAMLSAGAVCTAKPSECVPQLQLQTQSGRSRLCHVNADCTAGVANSELPLCCRVQQGGQQVQVCLNQLIAGFIGAACP